MTPAMNPERWQQVKGIFQQALERDSSARAAFLAQACGDDDALRSEVMLLLDGHAKANSFIETPAHEVAADFIAAPTSRVGQQLHHYQILALLGKGGMGEVYQARDTKLDRIVALKILPADVATNAERLRRFVREAKAASALNHPHVATIYEIGEANGVSFIAMEYVEGQSLAAKINGAPLPINEIVAIGSQMADALDEAHHKGITHRDLKPANVMLNERGQVKVLDFGLAKIARPASIESNVSTVAQTQAGIVMGTVPYMSPEQALGRDVDHRSDLFSLGVVLYEMATGRLPFAGANAVETLDRILHAEPEAIKQLNADAPAELERIVGKCLAKEREARYQSAAELLTALQTLPMDSEKPAARPAATREIKAATTGGLALGKARLWVRHWPVVTTLVAVLLVGLAASFFWRRMFTPQPGQSRPANTRRVNPVAYDEYLSGRYFTNRQNKAENETAITKLERAVAADPEFAAAQAELAQAYIWKLFLFTPKDKTLEEKAFMATEKALALDPNLGAGHLARGRLLWTPAQGFPHDQAIQEYRRALTLDPSLDEARNQLALVYNHIGAFEPALRELRHAMELNPTNSLAQFRIGETLGFQGKYEEAFTTLRRVPQDANRAKVSYHTAMALLHLGRHAEVAELAKGLMKDHPDDIEGGLLTVLQALLAALAGEEQKAEASIQSAIEKGKGFGHFHHTAYSIACAYALMKKTDLSIKWLQAAADDGFPCYALFENEPYLDSVKQDPRFVTLMTKLKVQWERYRTN